MNTIFYIILILTITAQTSRASCGWFTNTSMAGCFSEDCTCRWCNTTQICSDGEIAGCLGGWDNGVDHHACELPPLIWALIIIELMLGMIL